MKHFKIILVLITVFAITLFTYSCTRKNDFEEKVEIPIPSTTDIQDPPDLPDEPELIDVDYTLVYYDILTDSMVDFNSTETFVGGVEPMFFINKLSELMQIRINVNSIETSGEKMLIDFSSESAPLNGTGAYEESCILDSISDVMLDVFAGINKIHFTCDGKDYESGHLSLSADTPYEERRSKNNGR